jgi:hypothetical protein
MWTPSGHHFVKLFINTIEHQDILFERPQLDIWVHASFPDFDIKKKGNQITGHFNMVWSSTYNSTLYLACKQITDEGNSIWIPKYPSNIDTKLLETYWEQAPDLVKKYVV